MKILEEKIGSYHLAQDGDRYYLGVPDRYLVKLKPREVKDYLKWGTKALDDISKFLSDNPDKLEARNLAGVDLTHALHQYRGADTADADADAQMRLIHSSLKEQWTFFGKGDRYFLSARWSSQMMDLEFVVELLPEEVAAYKAFGGSFVHEFAKRIQGMSGSSPEFERNLNYHVAECMPEELEANQRLMDEIATARFNSEGQ